MSRRTPRILSLLLALLLAACQNGVTPAPGSSTPTPTGTGLAEALPPVSSPTPVSTVTPEPRLELTVTPAQLKDLEIGFWHPLSGSAAVLLEEQTRLFNLTNEWDINITLRATGSTSILEEALHAGAKAGMPDVVLAPSELLTAWDDPDPILVDLGVYMADPTWGLDPVEITGYDQRYWQQDQVDDKQIGLPALRTALGLVYNQSFAADLGFTSPPDTPLELFDQACASAKDNNRFYPRYGTGGWMLDTRSITALSWMTAFGAAVQPRDADSTWQFDQQGARDALEYLHEMQSAGCVWIPKYPTPQTYFSDRLAFLYTGTLQDLIPQQGAMSVAESQDEWTMIPFPSISGHGFVYAYGHSYALVRSSADLDAPRQMAAWLFIRWMSSKDRLVKLAEAWPSLPVRSDVRAALETKKGSFPWTVILPLADTALPAPAQPSWWTVRRPLEDAFWQTFNLATDEQLNTILPMLDSMAADLMNSP